MRVEDDQVVISHVYTERQVYPLNLYLREMSADRAEAAALDWGCAIKDLAAANIWPGDLFTKNFGVTRHGSVVFYDYDEITLLDECRFRRIPQSDDHEHEMRSTPWFTVEPRRRLPRTVPDVHVVSLRSAVGDLGTVPDNARRPVHHRLLDRRTGPAGRTRCPRFYPYPTGSDFARGPLLPKVGSAP